MHTLTLQPQRSKWFGLIISVLSLLALCCIFWIDLPLLIKFLLGLCVFIYSGYLLTRAIPTLRFSDEKGWTVISNEGHETIAELAGDSVVLRWLVLLNFKIDGRVTRCSVLLLPDSLKPQQFQYLRFLLALK